MGIFVNLKKIKALKSVYVSGMVRKGDLKLWLNYLCSSPLYMRYHISVPEGAIDQCLNDLANADEMETAEGLEDDAAAIDDPVCASRLLTLRQETVIWDDTAQTGGGKLPGLGGKVLSLIGRDCVVGCAPSLFLEVLTVVSGSSLTRLSCFLAGHHDRVH
ncbi:hypothetical protein MTO96_032318 [Rhipicephalus appendiculatus]